MNFFLVSLFYNLPLADDNTMSPCKMEMGEGRWLSLLNLRFSRSTKDNVSERVWRPCT